MPLELGARPGEGHAHPALSPSGDRLFFHRSAAPASPDILVATIFEDGGLAAGVPVGGLSTSKSERTAFADRLGTLWLAVGDDDAGDRDAPGKPR